MNSHPSSNDLTPCQYHEADDNDDDVIMIETEEDDTDDDEEEQACDDLSDDVDISSILLDKIKNIFKTATLSNDERLQRETINILLHCCDELMTRWITYRENYGENEDTQGVNWMKNDPETNDFMDQLCMVDENKDNNSSSTLIDLIFFVWRLIEIEKQQQEEEYVALYDHRHGRYHYQPTVFDNDIQQNICMIIMFLAW